MRNDQQGDAIDLRTERRANQALQSSTLVSQQSSPQVERVVIQQVVSTSGVASLTGTANQVNVSAATGAVTLSTPQNIHTGAHPTFAGVVSSTAGRFSIKAATPAIITADVNDYNPGAGGFFRISSDSAWRVTGIVAGADGDTLYLVNVGANDIFLRNEDASSTAANRIITGTGAAVTLSADDTAMLIYDAASARWRLWV